MKCVSMQSAVLLVALSCSLDLDPRTFKWRQNTCSEMGWSRARSDFSLAELLKSCYRLWTMKPPGLQNGCDPLVGHLRRCRARSHACGKRAAHEQVADKRPTIPLTGVPGPIRVSGTCRSRGLVSMASWYNRIPGEW
jgi:hypothetical protein